jgi:molybdate transport system substrate-binding protein
MTACSRPNAPALTIAVAASLQDAMGQLGPVFEQSHPGVRLSFNFGGSGMLAQQIERGAPADVFLAAASKPMNELAAQGLLRDDTRRDLLRSQIVLIAPAGTTLNSFGGLAASSIKLIALGEPGSVPAGDYGRQALESMGLWPAVQAKLVLAKDVRQVLTYVETGNADAGIVYATDVGQSPGVRIAAVAPETSHAPVTYPVAVLKDSRNPSTARAFVAFLEGPEAGAAFRRLGFTTVLP